MKQIFAMLLFTGVLIACNSTNKKTNNNMQKTKTISMAITVRFVPLNMVV